MKYDGKSPVSAILEEETVDICSECDSVVMEEELNPCSRC